jgi:hypothetical protein
VRSAKDDLLCEVSDLFDPRKRKAPFERSAYHRIGYKRIEQISMFQEVVRTPMLTKLATPTSY